MVSGIKINISSRIIRAAMKARKTGIEIQRLHETRFAVVVDGLVRYVGTLEECQRRAAILTPEDTAPPRTKRCGA